MHIDNLLASNECIVIGINDNPDGYGIWRVAGRLDEWLHQCLQAGLKLGITNHASRCRGRHTHKQQNGCEIFGSFSYHHEHLRHHVWHKFMACLWRL